MTEKSYRRWNYRKVKNAVQARAPQYFLLILALCTVAVGIPATSALPPAPYFPTGPDHGQHIHTTYTPSGLISSYQAGTDVTNGGGAGNVFYTVSGNSLSLKSKIFPMESGETVTVWVELCETFCTYIPPQNLHSEVRASQPGDSDVGSLTVTPYTPPNHGFSGTPTSGPAPLTVKFTDTSDGSWTAWSWTFGDGGNQYTPEPQSHLYKCRYLQCLSQCVHPG